MTVWTKVVYNHDLPGSPAVPETLPPHGATVVVAYRADGRYSFIRGVVSRHDDLFGNDSAELITTEEMAFPGTDGLPEEDDAYATYWRLA